MRRALSLTVIAAALAAIPFALPGTGAARDAGTPIYIAPSPTHECANLAFCFGIRGPWVVVPAAGEATFLLPCPVRAATRNAFIVGGSDALSSSGKIRVWFDGRLGAPIGSPAGTNEGLLFHAVSDNGMRGSFQPILGCVNLVQAAKRSTVSALKASAPPGTPHSEAAPRPRAKNLVLEPGWTRTFSVSCLRSEHLVGSWAASAFGTVGPPTLPAPAAIRITTVKHGRTVLATVRTDKSVQYLIIVQLGAVCE